MSKWIKLSVIEYLTEVKNALFIEEDLSKKIFDRSTKIIQETLVILLIEKNDEYLLDNEVSGLKFILVNKKFNDLRKIYEVFSYSKLSLPKLFQRVA